MPQCTAHYANDGGFLVPRWSITWTELAIRNCLVDSCSLQFEHILGLGSYDFVFVIIMHEMQSDPIKSGTIFKAIISDPSKCGVIVN